MGEVYKARDSRLERVVAVKVISPMLAASPELRQRFEREARTISRLSHPNICALYDIGEARPALPSAAANASDGGDAVRYLVLEYCEGQTLAERLLKGPLPLDQALRIGVEICDALYRAHAAGIVHRDLKPGNVMLTPRGAKLLDFGLARPGGAMVTSAGPAQSTSLPLTAEGTLVGTFQYMAPEQIEGTPADVRSDIWSLGCVLYEMVAGRRAFDAKSQPGIIAAILEREPEPVGAVLPGAPVVLDDVLRGCLTKSPADRIQSAHDVGLQLRWIAKGGWVPPKLSSNARHAGRERLAGAAAIAAALLLALPAYRYFTGRTAADTRAVVLSVPPPEGQSFALFDRFTLSPDASAVAFTTTDEGRQRTLWIRRFDSPTSLRIGAMENPGVPFWSPNGDAVAVFAGGVLQVVQLATGSTRRVITADGVQGAWSENGLIAFAQSDGGIFVVNADGSNLRRLTALDAAKNEAGHLLPIFTPDARSIVFSVARVPAVGRAPELDIRAVNVETAAITPLGIAGRAIAFDDDLLLFSTPEDALRAQPIDSRTLKVEGQSRAVLQWDQLTPQSVMRFSEQAGTLAYRGGIRPSMHRLTWFDRAGKVLGTVGDVNNYSNPALSPDGGRLAVGVRASETAARDIWLFDLGRATSTRLTQYDGDDFNPIWSPDGSRIAFSSERNGVRDVYTIASSGLEREEPLVQNAAAKSVQAWSADGRLIFFSLRRNDQADIDAVRVADRTVMRVLDGPASENTGALSPDGAFLAYESDESGKLEVFVRTFPGTQARWQISTAGGMEPQWRRDGRELYFLSGDDVMAVPIEVRGGRLEAGLPKRLFSQRLGAILRNRYVAAPDGQRFLLNVPITDRTTEPITVVMNWRQLAR